jgi:hypothetical protein
MIQSLDADPFRRQVATGVAPAALRAQCSQEQTDLARGETNETLLAPFSKTAETQTG